MKFPNIYDSLGTLFDRTIGILSPEREARRLVSRLQVRQARRVQEQARGQRRGKRYAASQTPRTSYDWTTLDPDINNLISSSSAITRARARQMVRDFPYFKRARNILINYTVGHEINYQSRVMDKSSTQPVLNQKTNQAIEDAWSRWMDECDLSGKLHFYDFLRLMKKQELECGEYFVRLVHTQVTRNRFIPFALELIEPDRVTNYDVTTSGQHIIDQGIEFNPETGEVMNYFVTPPAKKWPGYEYGKTVTVPAAAMLHDFDMERSGQLRGISLFHAAMMIAHDLSDYMDAEIDAAKMSAKWMAFVTSDNPSALQDAVAENEAGTDQKIEDMENAMIQYLKSGENIEFSNSNRPGSSFEPFVKLVLRMISVATDVSYQLLSGDYEGINFSTQKGIGNDMLKGFRPMQQRIIRYGCKPIFRAFMDSAVLSGRLTLPGYWQDPLGYQRGVWTPPGVESPDPLRESKAYISEIKVGLRSPQEVAAMRGRTLEDVYDEIQKAKDMASDRGLEFTSPSTSVHNNPAAVME